MVMPDGKVVGAAGWHRKHSARYVILGVKPAEVFEVAKLETFMSEWDFPAKAHREFPHLDAAIMWCVMQCAQGDG